jgi:hypothetical protein
MSIFDLRASRVQHSLQSAELTFRGVVKMKKVAHDLKDMQALYVLLIFIGTLQFSTLLDFAWRGVTAKTAPEFLSLSCYPRTYGISDPDFRRSLLAQYSKKSRKLSASSRFQELQVYASTRPEVLIQLQKVFEVSHWLAGHQDKVLLIFRIYKLSSTHTQGPPLENQLS